MSKIFSKGLFAAAAAAAAFTVACGHEEPPAQQEMVQAPVVAVEVRNVPRHQPYAGTIRAAAVSSLSSRVPGDVVAVHVTEGDRVTRGQLLIEIDDREASSQLVRARAEQRSVASAIDSAAAAVKSAQAHSQMAETTWRRFQALRQRGSISVHEYDQAEAAHRSAAAELERAKRTHDQLLAQRDAAGAAATLAETVSAYTQIRAPFEGVITGRHIDPGAQAGPGMPLVTIDRASRYRAEATVDESASIAAGHEVVVESGSISIRTAVTQVVPSLDPATRSALIKIDLPQTGPWRSGAFARILVPSGEEQAVTVPATAIVKRGQLNAVYALDRGGVARLRLITVGDTIGDRIEVLSGLSAGERIVATPDASIREGARIAGAGA